MMVIIESKAKKSKLLLETFIAHKKEILKNS